MRARSHHRRDFFKASGAAAIGAAVSTAAPASTSAQSNQEAVPGPIATLNPMTGGVVPISTDERKVRIAKAQALLEHGVEVDLIATSLAGSRPLRPDEPIVVLSVWNPSGARWVLEKPHGVAHPGVDAVVRAAERLKRPARGGTLLVEGPLRSAWRPWLERAP